MHTNQGKAYLVSLFVLTLILLAFYYPVLFAGREYFVSDHTYFFEPFARLISAALKEGRLPLWNPYLYCGMPQTANPSPGLFYFPSFLFGFLSYSKAMALTLLLSQLVAFTAGFFLALELELTVVLAIALGAIVALNGYMFSFAANYSLPATASWGFLSMVAFLKLNKARGREKLLYIAVSAWLAHTTIMAGRPEIFVPVFLVLGVVALLPLRHCFGKESDKARVVSDFAAVAVSFALALAMSMISILPTYEWTRLSPRASGLSLSQVFLWSANWYDYICLFTGQPLGDLQHSLSLYLAQVASRKGYYPFMPTACVGPIVLVLALLSFGAKEHKKRRLLFLLGFVIAAVLAAGCNTPVSGWLLKFVPPLAVLRYPVKLMVFVDLFLALLAVYGLKVAVTKPGRLTISLLSIFLCLTAVFAALYFCRDLYAAKPFTANGIAYTLAAPGFFEMLFRALAVNSLIASIFLAFLLVADKLAMKESERYAIAIGAIIASLATVSFMLPQRTSLGGFYRRPVLADRLTAMSQTANFDRANEFNGVGRYMTGYFDPLYSPRGYHARGDLNKIQLGENYMQYCRDLLLPNTSVGTYPVTGGYEAAATSQFQKNFLKVYKASSLERAGQDDLPLYLFCRLTATKFVGSQTKKNKGKGPLDVSLLDEKYFALKHESKALALRVYEVLQPTPRAYVSEGYEVVDGVVSGAAGGGSGAGLGSAAVGAGSSGTGAGGAGAVGTGSSGTGAGAAKENRAKEKKRDALVEYLEQKDSQYLKDFIEEDPLVDSPFEKPEFAFVDGDVRERLPLLVPADWGKTTVGDGGETNKRSKANSVHVMVDKPEHLAVAVTLKSPGYFILCDHFYPGWRVKVDSFEAKLARANGLMRAVKLEKGAHLVEFDYKSRSFALGLYLTVAGYAVALLLLVYCSLPHLWQIVLFLSYGKRGVGGVSAGAGAGDGGSAGAGAGGVAGDVIAPDGGGGGADDK